MNSSDGRSSSHSDINYFPPRAVPRQYLKSGTGTTFIATTSERVEEVTRTRRIFVCGFHPNHWDSPQKAVVFDLLRDYYISCNDDNVIDNVQTRICLSQSNAFIFFLNKGSLTDRNCLLTLQYAWHQMIPIVFLRPPGKQFILCKIANKRRSEIRIPGNGSIMKSSTDRSVRGSDPFNDMINYSLLTDIIYEGFQLSVIYDRHQHKKSMIYVGKRIKCVLKSPWLDKSTQTDCTLNNAGTQTEMSFVREEMETEGKERWERRRKVGYHHLDECDQQ